MTPAALLLLTDGRFPSGAHVHSDGLEATVAAGAVRDIPSLAAFLRGRLHTTGLVTAALTAATCTGADAAAIDAAADARTPAPALRRASRMKGRALIRAAARIWPEGMAIAAVHPDGPHQPVAFGALAAHVGVTPEDAALASVYGAVAGPATAAVRLLGLDPYAVHGLLAALGPQCEEIAVRAGVAARGPVERLPAASAPMLDIAATIHATREVRLFVS
jgi:urease accessory protein